MVIFDQRAGSRALSLVVSARMLEDPPFLEEMRKKIFKVDYVGLGLLATGDRGCLQVALDKGEREDWFSSSFIVSFSVIAVVRAGQPRSPGNIIIPIQCYDVRLFQSRNFSVACIMMFMLGAALYGATVLIPQLLQTLMGYTAQQAGMVLSPGGLVIIGVIHASDLPVAGQDGRALAGSCSALVAPRWRSIIRPIGRSAIDFISTTSDVPASTRLSAWASCSFRFKRCAISASRRKRTIT